MYRSRTRETGVVGTYRSIWEDSEKGFSPHRPRAKPLGTVSSRLEHHSFVQRPKSGKIKDRDLQPLILAHAQRELPPVPGEGGTGVGVAKVAAF